MENEKELIIDKLEIIGNDVKAIKIIVFGIATAIMIFTIIIVLIGFLSK